MVKLIMSRYGGEVTFEYETLQKAATAAVRDLENDQAYPVKIVDTNGKSLWEENEGPFGSKLDELRKIEKGVDKKP